MVTTTSELAGALVAELAWAIEARSGAPVAVTPGDAIEGPAWQVALAAAGTLRGTVSLALEQTGVNAVAAAALGAAGDVTEAATAQFLRELAEQAARAVQARDAFIGLTLSVGPVAVGEALAPSSDAFTLTAGATTLRVSVIASLNGAAEEPAAAATPAANLNVVMDIELPLTVRFGRTVMSIRSLSTLGPGSIVDMSRSPDEPVEVLVCGRVIARAEVVVVGGNYGVRITDLVSAADRVRALEGQW